MLIRAALCQTPSLHAAKTELPAVALLSGRAALLGPYVKAAVHPPAVKVSYASWEPVHLSLLDPARDDRALHARLVS